MSEAGEHLDWVVFAILSAFVVYSLLSKAIGRRVLTLPMIFVAIGYGLSHPLAAAGEPEMVAEGTRLLAEITLILVLFSDASKVRFMQRRTICPTFPIHNGGPVQMGRLNTLTMP